MVKRRNVLCGVSSGLALAVAGCTGSGDDESPSSESDSDQQDTEQDAEPGEPQQGEQSPSAQQGGDVPPVEIVIDYWSDWSGNISTPESSMSVQGYGKDGWKIDGYPASVSVVAQKEDDTRDPLTVEIYVDGSLAAEQSTTAEYGVVRLSVRP